MPINLDEYYGPIFQQWGRVEYDLEKKTIKLQDPIVLYEGGGRSEPLISFPEWERVFTKRLPALQEFNFSFTLKTRAEGCEVVDLDRFNPFMEKDEGRDKTKDLIEAARTMEEIRVLTKEALEGLRYRLR